MRRRGVGRTRMTGPMLMQASDADRRAIYPVTVKSANLLTSELPCSSPLSGGAMSGRASRSKVRKSGVLVPCHYPELLGPTRALVMLPQHRNRARCLHHVIIR